MPTPSHGLRRFALVATTVGATTVVAALGSGGVAIAADGPTPAPKAPLANADRLDSLYLGKLRGLDRSAAGRQTVFVRFSGQGGAVAGRIAPDGTTDKARVKAHRARVASQSDSALATARGRDSSAVKLFTVSNALDGAAYRTDRAGLEALARRSDVVKISRITSQRPTNSNAAQLTKAVDTWRSLGYTGRGVTIAVIDSGLDYTHADFGGPGTTAAYDAAFKAGTDPNWYSAMTPLARAKVVGGYDLSGDAYNPDPQAANYSPVPKPDPNPLDCAENGHGTHVAGTAAGFGVTPGGVTFRGNPSRLSDASLDKYRIGPGMAPRARLLPLRVFGCSGSTDLTTAALDRALDPNGDGDFSDRADIVNLSLGSDAVPADDPQNDVIDALAENGVLSVIAAGNAGDITDVGGSPGNATSALTAASSVDSFQLRDGLKVDAPAAVAGIEAGQVSSAYDWATKPPVSGSVVAIPGDNDDGCAPLSAAEAARVNGKVAWLEWDDNDATRRCGSARRSGNVKAAGAIGSVFTSELNVFGAGILGDPDIPVFQLPKTGTNRLRPALDAGTLKVTFDGALRATIKNKTPAITDTLSGFTSRGTHGSVAGVKPDVAAPGDTIASAGVGSGNGVLVESGTSMATPLTAGISALVQSRHRAWTPLMVKAAVMNTATHDLYTGENRTGRRYGPARVGSGRVDALAAAKTNLLVWSPGENNPVSASFGVVPVPADQARVTRTLPLKVANGTKVTKTVRLGYDPVITQPGVSYSVSPTVVRVPARGTASARVTMTVDGAALRHTIDPTMSRTQAGLARQYVSDASGHLTAVSATAVDPALRLPVYGAAKPASTTSTTVTPTALEVKGKGFDQGSRTTKWTSYLSVLQLGARSGTLPICSGAQQFGCTATQTDRAADIEYVGANIGPDGLWFGISTYGDWPTVGTWLIPFFDIDVDGDGKADFETYAQTYPDSDVLLSVTENLKNGESDLQAVNFNLGDRDTNVFDNNQLLLPVDPAFLGLSETSGPISYVAGTYSAAIGDVIDETDPATFAPNDPALVTDGPLFLDEGGTKVSYSVSGTNPVEALVLHLHGAKGSRAEVRRVQR